MVMVSLVFFRFSISPLPLTSLLSLSSLSLPLPLQDYSLRDPASIMKAVKHSNVVINLVGRDYETRYIYSIYDND